MLEYVNSMAKSYFCSDSKTELTQVVIGFTMGLLLAPFSMGLMYFLFWTLIVEVMYAYYSEMKKPHWRWLARLAIFSAAFYGFILGRWLIIGKTIDFDPFIKTR